MARPGREAYGGGFDARGDGVTIRWDLPPPLEPRPPRPPIFPSPPHPDEAPITPAEWRKLMADVKKLAEPPKSMSREGERSFLSRIVVRDGVEVTDADRNLADMVRYTDGGERDIPPSVMADIVWACALARKRAR